ncbi:site-2 protease family protein [bacterium]|nr:site-2 protease family protein [bacterium]MCB9478467.1 site-2 protease family protein [Deltaproteobacteria bacterium]
MNVLIFVPALILAVSVHEAAHAWVAWKLGDATAQMLGRVTLNPVRHIDPFGSVIVPIILAVSGGGMFGWAKPVPVDTGNLEEPKKDHALIAAAGPISNLLLALVAAFLLRGLLFLPESLIFVVKPLANLMYALIWINVILAVFNMLPIPPLDGSKVVAILLPDDAAEAYMSIGAYGFLIILLVFFFDPFHLNIWGKYLAPVIQTGTGFFESVAGLKAFGGVR